MEAYAGEDQSKYHFLFMISAEDCLCESDKLILSGIDKKTLFMTARPGRCRAFIPTNRFFETWKNHDKSFTENPPNVAIIHSNMKKNAQGKAKAIPFQVTHPEQEGLKWTFHSNNLSPGYYQNIVLFIDWPAAIICPEPIRLVVPGLFKGHSA